MSWETLLQIKRELLEEVLKDFEDYGVDGTAKAIIEGKLDGIKNLQGDK